MHHMGCICPTSAPHGQLALSWGPVASKTAHIGPLSGPNSAADAPTQDQVTHAESTVAPCWTLIGLKLGPTWAIVSTMGQVAKRLEE